MPFCGTYWPPASPGEIQPFSIDMTSQLETGDSIPADGVTATLAVHQGNDPQVQNWLQGSPFVTGAIVTQFVGAPYPQGLQPGVSYVLTFNVTTAFGRERVNFAYILCDVIQ